MNEAPGGAAPPVLEDDLDLLRAMIADQRDQPTKYRPGPYWAAESAIAANEIERCGIQDFRGASNAIGSGYSDHLFIDVRHTLNRGVARQVAAWATRSYPLRAIYDRQVRQTEAYARETIRLVGELAATSDRARRLLRQYSLPYSLLGGCVATVRLDGQDVAVHYLNLLDRHDHLSALINFGAVRSVFEIGGGFGANMHVLLENYPSIRKVAYLDIPPNLYVGTQYLRAFHGVAVADYCALRARPEIRFSTDDRLEIFCLAPWQIERFVGSVDVLINSHSFVEMPKAAVANYAAHLREALAPDAAVALTSYDRFDPATTWDPDDLPKFFAPRKFTRIERPRLLDTARQNLFYISAGRFACA